MMKKIDKKIILLILILAMIICAVLIIIFSKEKQEKNKSILKSDRIGEINLIADKSINVGNEFEVDIDFDSFKSDIVLVAGEINYDCSNIELVRIDSKKDLSLDIFKESSDNRIYIARGEPGDADYQDSDDGHIGKGQLATLVFRALASGTCQLNLNADESQMILDDGKGTPMTVNLNDVIININ